MDATPWRPYNLSPITYNLMMVSRSRGDTERAVELLEEKDTAKFVRKDEIGELEQMRGTRPQCIGKTVRAANREEQRRSVVRGMGADVRERRGCHRLPAFIQHPRIALPCLESMEYARTLILLLLDGIAVAARGEFGEAFAGFWDETEGQFCARFDEHLERKYSSPLMLFQTEPLFTFASVLFVIAAVLVWIRNRRKLRRMEAAEKRGPPVPE